LVLNFPENYSQQIIDYKPGSAKIPIELYGDVSNFNYLMGAVWAYEGVKQYVNAVIKAEDPYEIIEKPIGITATMSEFDFYIPGMLVFAVVMLMFTASIALIKDVENGTIKRMILARIPVFALVGGISVVQIILGFAGVALSLILAMMLGFNYAGSLFTIILITLIACISVIAFSIIVAALTRSANQILVVGVFPMFLFMFFTGIMFPMPSKALFTVAGYDFCLNGFISTTPAVTALQKVMLYGQGIKDVLPEIILMSLLTAIYALIGGWLFKRRHLRQIN
jgi:ABC-2 type transport system permease protein